MLPVLHVSDQHPIKSMKIRVDCNAIGHVTWNIQWITYFLVLSHAAAPAIITRTRQRVYDNKCFGFAAQLNTVSVDFEAYSRHCRLSKFIGAVTVNLSRFLLWFYLFTGLLNRRLIVTNIPTIIHEAFIILRRRRSIQQAAQFLTSNWILLMRLSLRCSTISTKKEHSRLFQLTYSLWRRFIVNFKL